VTVWLSRDLILAVHDEQLKEHGGATGLRDAGMLESALARPLNRAASGKPDLADFAALYALGIVRNRPFVDGNKRTAYVALESFPALNGVRFRASDADAVVMMLRMADHDVDDEAFAAWIRANLSCR
jgi:death on curing protein